MIGSVLLSRNSNVATRRVVENPDDLIGLHMLTRQPGFDVKFRYSFFPMLLMRGIWPQPFSWKIFGDRESGVRQKFCDLAPLD